MQQFPRVPFPPFDPHREKKRSKIHRSSYSRDHLFLFFKRDREREEEGKGSSSTYHHSNDPIYIYICVPEEDPRRRSFSPENHSHLCSPPPVIDSPRTCTDDTRSERSVKSTQQGFVCFYRTLDPGPNEEVTRRGGGRKRDDPTDSITLMYIYMCIPADIRIAEGDPVSESRDLHSTPPVVETD